MHTCLERGHESRLSKALAPVNVDKITRVNTAVEIMTHVYVEETWHQSVEMVAVSHLLYHIFFCSQERSHTAHFFLLFSRAAAYNRERLLRIPDRSSWRSTKDL